MLAERLLACLVVAWAPATSAGDASVLFITNFGGVAPCSLSAWANTGAGGGAVGTPVSGTPADVPSVPRYSDQCALLATSGPSFVRDMSPFEEPNYVARIHVYTGLASGEVVFLHAADAAANSKIRVSYQPGATAFRIYTGADTTADATIAGVQSNRWYSIEIDFSNASPAELRYTIRGAGAATPLANDFVITSGISGTDVIDHVEVGWVSTLSAATGAIVVDEFYSARSGAIPAICRGDADRSETLEVRDTVKISRELAGAALAPGMPDCDENGAVNAIDRVCARVRILADQSCP
jgi:hypothetical protein